MKDDASKSLLAYPSSPKQAPADGFLVSHSRWAFSFTSKCPILTAESAQEDRNYPISKHVASVSEATCLIHRRVLDCLRRYLQTNFTCRNMSRKMYSQRTGSHCGKKKIIPSKQVPIFAWKMIAEVCASKLGFSQRSTCRGFSFASLQVGFVVCPRRTAFSRLDMKNISRSILPHLSEGPRCRPKVPAIQARGGKRERHRMMWGAKNTYHICLWLRSFRPKKTKTSI